MTSTASTLTPLIIYTIADAEPYTVRYATGVGNNDDSRNQTAFYVNLMDKTRLRVTSSATGLMPSSESVHNTASREAKD
jgi:hypothetical protein